MDNHTPSEDEMRSSGEGVTVSGEYRPRRWWLWLRMTFVALCFMLVWSIFLTFIVGLESDRNGLLPGWISALVVAVLLAGALLSLRHTRASTVRRLRWEEAGLTLEWFGKGTNHYRWGEIASIRRWPCFARLVMTSGRDVFLPTTAPGAKRTVAALRLYLGRKITSPAAPSANRRLRNGLRFLFVGLMSGLVSIFLPFLLLGVLVNTGGYSESPFLIGGIELLWALQGGPYQRDFDGFQYDYWKQEGPEVVRYQVQVWTSPADDSRAPVYVYRKDRYRSRDEAGGEPRATTSGAIRLTEAQLKPLQKAVRSWRGPKGDPPPIVPTDGDAYPRLEFTGGLRFSGFRGMFGDWDYEYYWIQCEGKPPKEVVVLLTAVERSLPRSVRTKWPLPLPPSV